MASSTEVTQKVSRVVEKLGLRIVGKLNYRLIDIVMGYIVPNWHPCPCNHTPEERIVVEDHLEDLATRGESLLNPVITATVLGVKVILAPTCIAEAALVMYKKGRRDVLEGVKAEVWDLGEFNEPFLAKAAAALLCIVYGGRRHSEVRLSFIEDYLKHRVLEITGRNSKDWAIKFIEGLEQRRDIMLLVDELARITGLSRREIHRYLSAVLNNQFIKELRDLVRNADDVMVIIENMRKSRDGEGEPWPMARLYINTISNKLNIDPSNLKPLNILSKRSLETLTKAVVELMNRDNEGGARDLVTKVLRHLENGEADKAVELISRKYGETIEEKTPSTNDRVPREPTPRFDTATTNDSEQPTKNTHPPQRTNEETWAKDTETMNTKAINVLFRKNFELTCSEDLCNIINELARASRNGNTKAMLEASITLTSELANKLGLNQLRDLLNTLTKNLNNEKLTNTLLKVLETYNKDETTTNHLMELLNDPNAMNTLLTITNDIKELLKAVKDGNAETICEAMQHLTTNLRNLLPSSTRNNINIKVNCN